MQFIKNDCPGSNVLQVAKTAFVLSIFVVAFSSCSKFENDIRYVDVNYRLFKGSLSSKDLMQESKSWMPFPQKGTAVYKNTQGEEKRFELGLRVNGYSAFDFYGNYRPMVLLPPLGFETEIAYQRIKEENGLMMEFQLGIIPFKSFEWKEGRKCMDYFHVSIDSVKYENEATSCGFLIGVNDRQFEGITKVYSNTYLKDEVVLQEGIVLEEVYELTLNCGATNVIYAKEGIGVLAFRESNGELWLYDRVEN